MEFFSYSRYCTWWHILQTAFSSFGITLPFPETYMNTVLKENIKSHSHWPFAFKIHFNLFNHNFTDLTVIRSFPNKVSDSRWRSVYLPQSSVSISCSSIVLWGCEVGLRGAGGGDDAQFNENSMAFAAVYRWTVVPFLCVPSQVSVLDSACHGPALQGEEVTLPSLPRLGASALLPVCSVAGAGAAPRLLWPPGCVPWPGPSWAHICPGKPAAAPHRQPFPSGPWAFQEPL